MYGAAQSACEVVLFKMFIGSSLIFARAYDRYVNGGKMKQLITGVHHLVWFDSEQARAK